MKKALHVLQWLFFFLALPESQGGILIYSPGLVQGGKGHGIVEVYLSLQYLGVFYSQASLRFCYSVFKSCLTLCNPMNWSMPGSPVLHCLPEFAQIYVHCIGDAK